MIIKSLGLSTQNVCSRPDKPVRGNAIRITNDPMRARWIRKSYRYARQSGCSEYAARNLVWEVLFVAHLHDGGVWIDRTPEMSLSDLVTEVLS